MNRKQKAAAEKAAAEKKAFIIVDMSSSIQLDEYEQAAASSVQANIEDAANLTNKSLVRIARRTYANSIIMRNAVMTETAILDMSIAAFHDFAVLHDCRCTLQMIIKFIAEEFKTQVTRTRFVDHVTKNKYHKQNTVILKNDEMQFKLM